jgi:hypothetical protein
MNDGAITPDLTWKLSVQRKFMRSAELDLEAWPSYGAQ